MRSFGALYFYIALRPSSVGFAAFREGEGKGKYPRAAYATRTLRDK